MRFEKEWIDYKKFEHFNSIGSPTYQFKIGQKVAVGNLKNCVVEDIVDDNGFFVYGISYNKDNAETKSVTYFPWYRVRPLLEKKEHHLFQKTRISMFVLETQQSKAY